MQATCDDPVDAVPLHQPDVGPSDCSAQAGVGDEHPDEPACRDVECVRVSRADTEAGRRTDAGLDRVGSSRRQLVGCEHIVFEHRQQHPIAAEPRRLIRIVGRARRGIDAPGCVDERSDVGRLRHREVRGRDAIPSAGRGMHSIGTTTQVGDVCETLENLRPAQLATQS